MSELAKDTVDEILKLGTFAADYAILSVRPTTYADRTPIAVKAAIRHLVGIGLLSFNVSDEEFWERYKTQGYPMSTMHT
jgi:hypothetical protein